MLHNVGGAGDATGGGDGLLQPLGVGEVAGIALHLIDSGPQPRRRGATEGGLINQQGLHPVGAQGRRRLTQEHGAGLLEIGNRGAKRGRTAQLPQTIKELLGTAGWIVGQADRHKLQTGSSHPLLRISYADQAHPMAALAQGMAEGWSSGGDGRWRRGRAGRSRSREGCWQRGIRRLQVA